MQSINTHKRILITLPGLLLLSIFLFAQAGNVMAKEPGVERYALVEEAAGKVVNIILWDPSSIWSPPEGHFVILSDKAGPGDTWNGTEFKKAPQQEQEQDSLTIQADGNDIAELMQQVDESLIEPGDVVAVSELGSGIRRSNTPYDRNIIGVISTNPGVILGDSQGVDQQKVALVGRVPVKVSMENGPIEPGDRLTSSSAFGFAMKATQAGPVIGIALETFDTNNQLAISTATNKIMMLVSPHWQGGDLSVQENTSGQLVNIDPEQLRVGLAGLGLEVNPNGTLTLDILKAKKIVLERLEVKDQITGSIYCTWIENGEWVKILSDCDSIQFASVPSPEPAPEPELVVEEPLVEEEPPVEEPVVEELIDLVETESLGDERPEGSSEPEQPVVVEEEPLIIEEPQPEGSSEPERPPIVEEE